MQGWIKLHRKLLQNPIFNNEKILKVFIWCLLKASHKDYELMVGLQKIELKKGQFVYGRNQASSELGLKERTFRLYMDTLKSFQILNIEPTNKFSVATLINWELYQDESINICPQNANKVPTKCQQSATNKNDKNLKNEKNEKKYIYSEFSNILLTEMEYEKLNTEYGELNTKKAIEYLSLYKEEKDYKTKSDYLTLKRWVFTAISKEELIYAGTKIKRVDYSNPDNYKEMKKYENWSDTF